MTASRPGPIRRGLRSPHRVLWVLIAWNALDVVLHVAVGRPELLRITANVLAVGAAVAADRRWVTRRDAGLLVGAAVATIVLNTVFGALEGVAVPMLVLVVGSVVLCTRAAGLLAQARPATSRRRKAAWAATGVAGVLAWGCW